MNDPFYTSYMSPIGRILIASTKKGICKLVFFQEENEFRKNVSSEFKGRAMRDDERFQTVKEMLGSYFQGKPTKFIVAFNLKGTSFQKRVWAEIAKIEYGRTKTYKEIACAINRPTASRAVGNAVGSNPVPLIIPCHRVIRSDRTLGGFGYGIPLKKKLLEMEKAVW